MTWHDMRLLSFDLVAQLVVLCDVITFIVWHNLNIPLLYFDFFVFWMTYIFFYVIDNCKKKLWVIWYSTGPYVHCYYFCKKGGKKYYIYTTAVSRHFIQFLIQCLAAVVEGIESSESLEIMRILINLYLCSCV